MGIASINPTNGTIVQRFEALTSAEIDDALGLAHTAFQSYRRSPFDQRRQCLNSAASLLEDRAQEWGELMTLEMGKPLSAAIAEVKKCAWVCRYYAEQGEGFLQDKLVETDVARSLVRYQPLGVVLGVMPWNFPFWQVFRFAAPTLMAGNAIVLKHASNVPQCAIAIETIFREAGFPKGVFRTLLVGSDAVEQIIADDRIEAATLTGSEAAGASLASAAGQQIKKVVLELGGSDPFIVLESADLAKAAKTAIAARMLNNGQSCIAAKRFIVQESVADAFIEQLLPRFAALKMGDPMDADTDIGPLATPAIRNELHRQVQACVASGATVLVSGGPKTMPPDLQAGNFYPPTLLANIPAGTPAEQEEFFGPVALLFRVDTLDEAIALANNVPFGLGASAWTTDATERDRLIDELDAGAVFINDMVKSDPRLPFGGIKASGFGRELGVEGIREFVNVKTVWVNL
ncbi:MAG: NAD-dependent succinate-semialdehyde dehydrogenase [Elainellaceae cyanobacterium]